MPEDFVNPSSPEELAQALREAAASGRPIELTGGGSKPAFGGPRAAEAARVGVGSLNQVLAYEPDDLTISVGAGMRWAELERLLGERGQMLPLDPPFAEQATVGGVLAVDHSGPRRRRYGTARDMVIGMKFATVEGHVVQSGGMVVKNVTGLDMAKLLIGSYGTLAAIATANFKVFPRPDRRETFLVQGSREAVSACRREILNGSLQPTAIDLLNGPGMALAGRPEGDAWTLALEATGGDAAIERCTADYAAVAARHEAAFEYLEDAEAFRAGVRNFAPQTLAAHPEAVLLRVSTTPSRLAGLAEALPAAAPILMRAGAGAAWVGTLEAEAAELIAHLRRGGFATLIEAAPAGLKQAHEQWEAPDAALQLMRRIKQELDPGGLLNPGRLFGRI